MDRTAFPIVVSGPSGVGKSTIARRVLDEDPLTAYSVSVTTRPARHNEKDRAHYEFVSDERFDELVEAGELAEWAVVHGFRYGTRKAVIDEIAAQGKNVVMDVTAYLESRVDVLLGMGFQKNISILFCNQDKLIDIN